MSMRFLSTACETGLHQRAIRHELRVRMCTRVEKYIFIADVFTRSFTQLI